MDDSTPDYTNEQQKEIGKALGAVLEFLGLNQDCLVVPEICKDQTTISAFIRGKRPLAPYKIRLIPGILMQAYKKEYNGEEPPEIARFETVDEMRQKGLALATLDKAYLRAGITRVLQEKILPEKLALEELIRQKNALEELIREKRELEKLGNVNSLARQTGVSRHELNEFLNNKGRRANLSTNKIAKTTNPLGLRDIFELNDMGRAVCEQLDGPHSAGRDERGKPLPEAPEAAQKQVGILRSKH